MVTDILIAWVEEAEKTRTSKYQVYGRSNPGTGQQRRRSRCLNSSMYLQRLSSRSRVEIKYENYAKVINIEAKTMIDMASKQIIPAIIKYTKTLADTVVAVKAAGVDASCTGRDY